jgi:hypoxanthine phosphoribosyltransferase
MLSHKLGIPMTQDPHFPNILVVDDICDSGETFKRWFTFNPEYTFACLHFKPHTSDFNPTFLSNIFISDAFISYPWEQKNADPIADYLKNR